MKTLNCAVLTSLLLGSSLAAQDAPDRYIIVSGHGEASTVADIAKIQMSITAIAGSGDSAVVRAASRAQAVLDSIADRGFEEVDFITNQFRVRPGREDQRTGMPIEYEVQNSFTVRVHDTESVADVIHAALRAADVQVGGIEFDVEDHQALRRSALEAAVNDGKAKAELIADNLGVRLGRLTYSRSPEERVSVLPVVGQSRFEEARTARTPIRVDSAVATTTLSLRFEIED